MRLSALFLLLFILPGSTWAQKQTVKDADAAGLQVLQIDVDNIYRLEVIATATDRFKAVMNSEGEYSTQMALNTLQAGTTWNVNVGFAPGFEPADDKLGAHKVVSVDLTLEIPKGKNVLVSGRCLKVELSGVFDRTDIILDAGNIVARDFKADGVLSTKEGSIKVYAQADVAAQVAGAPTKLINELNSPANHNLKVMATNGSIKLRKAKN